MNVIISTIAIAAIIYIAASAAIRFKHNNQAPESDGFEEYEARWGNPYNAD